MNSWLRLSHLHLLPPLREHVCFFTLNNTPCYVSLLVILICFWVNYLYQHAWYPCMLIIAHGLQKQITKYYPQHNPLYYIAANSALPRPLLEKLRSCLVTLLTMPCPKGIQSVIQSRANVYTGASKLKVWEVSWLVRMQFLKCHRASVSHRISRTRINAL